MRQVQRSEVRIYRYEVTIIAAPEWAFRPWEDRYTAISDAFVDVLAEIQRIRDGINERRKAEYEEWLVHAPGSEWTKVLRKPRTFRRAMSRLAYPTEKNRKQCAACGAWFFGMGNTLACSDRCAKVRRDATRTPGEDRRVVRQARTCEHCREPFMPARSDARFCSGRCRVASHRASPAP